MNARSPTFPTVSDKYLQNKAMQTENKTKLSTSSETNSRLKDTAIKQLTWKFYPPIYWFVVIQRVLYEIWIVSSKIMITSSSVFRGQKSSAALFSIQWVLKVKAAGLSTIPLQVKVVLMCMRKYTRARLSKAFLRKKQDPSSEQGNEFQRRHGEFRSLWRCAHVF